MKVAYIHLEDVLGTATQPSLCVSLTEDWQYLLVLTPGSLNIVSLHCYFETYPDNISVKQMSHEVKLTAAHGLNVSHAKDSVWTAKLAKVKKAADFGSTHVFDELAWFEKAGLKPAAAMDVQSAEASSDGMMRRRHKVEVCEELVRHVVLGAWSDKMSLKDVCGGSQLTYILLQANSDDEQDILIAVQVMSGQTAVHRSVDTQSLLTSGTLVTVTPEYVTPLVIGHSLCPVECGCPCQMFSNPHILSE